MWKCPNCETVNTGDICQICGEKRVVYENHSNGYVNHNENNSGVTTPYPPYPPKKNNNKLVIILVIIILLIVLIIGVFVLTQLLGNNSSDEEYTSSETRTERKTETKNKTYDSGNNKILLAQEGEEIVIDFMNAFKDGQFREAFSYVEGGKPSDFSFNSTDDFIDVILENAGDEIPTEYSQVFTDMYKNSFDAYFSTIDYEIYDVNESSDEVTYSLTVSYADLESVDFYSFGEEIGYELAENGYITQDMSEEEMLEVLFYTMADELPLAIKGADSKTEYIEITIINDDGELIISDDSNISSFVDEIANLINIM